MRDWIRGWVEMTVMGKTLNACNIKQAKPFPAMHSCRGLVKGDDSP